MKYEKSKKAQFSRITYVISIFLFVFIFMFLLSQSEAFSKGNSLLNVTYNLANIGGRAYSSDGNGAVFERHLVLNVSYDGSAAPSSFSINLSNFNSTLTGNLNVSSIRLDFYNISNATIQVPVGKSCFPFNTSLTNITGITITTNPNCTTSYGNATIDASSWIPISQLGSITLKKKQSYYFDFVGTINSPLGVSSTDIQPSLILSGTTFSMPELAFWNASYLYKQNISINQSMSVSLDKMPYILNSTNINISNYGQFAIAENDLIQIPDELVNYTGTTAEIWAGNSTIDLNGNSNISIYYTGSGNGTPASYQPQRAWLANFTNSKNFVLHLNGLINNNAVDSLGNINFSINNSINTLTSNVTCPFAGNCIFANDTPTILNHSAVISNDTSPNGTLSMWVKVNQNTAPGGTSCVWGNNAGGRTNMICIVPDNHALRTDIGDQGDYTNSTPLGTLQNNTWYLITMRYRDSLRSEIWLNNTPIVAHITGGTPINGASYTDFFFSSYQANTFAINMTVAEIRFKSEWASDQEINQSYQMGIANWAIINATVGLNGSSSNTCTYSSGNWAITCSDNCTITTNTALAGNNITVSGSGGSLNINANVTNFANFYGGKCWTTVFKGARLR